MYNYAIWTGLLHRECIGKSQTVEGALSILSHMGWTPILFEEDTDNPDHFDGAFARGKAEVEVFSIEPVKG